MHAIVCRCILAALRRHLIRSANSNSLVRSAKPHVSTPLRFAALCTVQLHARAGRTRALITHAPTRRVTRKHTRTHPHAQSLASTHACTHTPSHSQAHTHARTQPLHARMHARTGVCVCVCACCMSSRVLPTVRVCGAVSVGDGSIDARQQLADPTAHAGERV